MHKFTLILLYFDEKIKCISATHISVYVQTCDPPPIFLVNLTNSTEFDSHLCNCFVLFGINPLIFCSITQIHLFIEILILYFLPLNRVFPAARCIFKLLP